MSLSRSKRSRTRKTAVRATKFGNVPTKVDGIQFASKLEAARYKVLKKWQEKGIIYDLKVHPTFKIEHLGISICKYIADFSYYKKGCNDLIVEDTKGVITEVFTIKKRLMYALKGIAVRIIRKPDQEPGPY
jgi:hypothetical protein